MSIEVDPLTAFVDVDVSGDVVEVEVVGQGEKGDPGGGAFDGDASDVPYTPATEGDWDPVPAQVAEALDELAAGGGGGAVDSVNGETGVVVLDAGDVGADPAGTAAGLVDDLSGVTNAATARSNLGLGNVDNTSDANKPVSSAQQTALDGKAATSHSHSGADITSGIVPPAVLGTGGAGGGAKFLADDQTFKTPPSLGAVLSNVTLTGTQTTISFTSIPSTYTHLVIVFQGRSNASGLATTGFRMTLNNDTGSNYNGQYVGGNNASAIAAIQSAAAFGYLGNMPAANATTGYSMSGSIEIPNYAGTTFFKNALFQTTRDENGAGANMVTYRGHIVWKSTSAINRLNLVPQYGDFIAGSRFTLYGIV